MIFFFNFFENHFINTFLMKSFKVLFIHNIINNIDIF